MKKNAYQEYIRSGMMHNYYVCLENLVTELLNLIHNTKTQYHSKLAAKLVNPSASAKTYWLILNIFANGRQVSVIPPLLINNRFLILRLKLIISTDSLTNNVQQFPQIAPYPPLSILQQMKLQLKSTLMGNEFQSSL